MTRSYVRKNHGKNGQVNFAVMKKRLSLKESLLYGIEIRTWKRPFNYKNYRII